MIEWSLDALRACAAVRRIVVAVPPGHERDLESRADLAVLAGGATRAQSVANTLAAVETELVAIHDAARPLLRPALLEALVAELEANPQAAGAIAAIPVADTLKRAAALSIEETVDRAGLWAAQTPQVFRTDALRGALDIDAGQRDAATDEAMLIEAAGGTVLLHHSRGENLKVTTPEDLRLAELLLRDRD
jgi:2-C-methyl-D-erythritol 4-phosphate cytidylyltransferase